MCAPFDVPGAGSSHGYLVDHLTVLVPDQCEVPMLALTTHNFLLPDDEKCR